MPLINLTPDEVDDLIYFVRSNDMEGLEFTLSELMTKYDKRASVIIASAVDTFPQEEGGSGCSLFHYAAANGNTRILEHLSNILASAHITTGVPLTEAEIKSAINHANYSGNTPLHWAALNTHLECVKILVNAGADVGIKNEAGHDAIFLAERADWAEQAKAKGRDEARDEDADEEVEITVGEGQGQGQGQAQDAGPKTKGREVVEWLLEFGDPMNPPIPVRDDM
ncbi:ankyrin repeat domain-containing protein [Aspergillus undulatus]|uniref:ankyrin repeat domain-containing protein n=1 Tax=Aspergillus undulatus TaxID=1810928 RepID=UPI003CCDC840